MLPFSALNPARSIHPELASFSEVFPDLQKDKDEALLKDFIEVEDEFIKFSRLNEKEIECPLASTKESAEEFLRFFSHVFLDRNLLGSELEGFSEAQVIPLLIGILREIDNEEFKLTPIIEQFTELNLTSSHKSFNNLYDRDFLVETLSKFVEQIVAENLKDEVLPAVRLIDFKKDVEEVFEHSKIQALYLAKNMGRICDFFSEKFNELVVLQGCFDISEKKSFILRTILREELQKKFSFFLLKEYEESSKDLLLFCKERIKALKVGEDFLVNSGYLSFPSSHSALVLISKTCDKFYSFSIINTGSGVEMHDRIDNELITVGSAQKRSQKAQLKQPSVINPVLTYEKIPAEILLMEENGIPLIFKEIFNTRSPEYFCYSALQNQELKSSLKIYNIIARFLSLHGKKKDYNQSLAILSHEQKSGTCVIQALKTRIKLYFSDPIKYKKFTYILKIEVLTRFFLQISHTENLVLLKIGKHATENFLTTIYKDYQRAEIRKDKEVFREAVGTALDVQRRLSKRIQDKHEKAKTEEISLTFFPKIEDIHSQCEVKGQPAFLQNLLSVRNLTPSSIAEKKKISEDQLPQLYGSEGKMYEDLEKIFELHQSIQGKDSVILEIFPFWIAEYIKQLPFPVHWEEKISYPKKVIKGFSELSYFVGQSNLTDSFALQWKLFCISLNLIKIIHGNLLDSYPVDNFGFRSGVQLNLIDIPSPEIAEMVRLTLSEIDQHNQKAVGFTRPLFYEVDKFKIHLDLALEHDATFKFYLQILKENPQLRNVLKASLEEKEKEILDYELIGPLFCDFGEVEGVHAKINLEEIVFLKNIYMDCLFSFHKRRNIKGVAKYSFDKTTKIIQFSKENKIDHLKGLLVNPEEQIFHETVMGIIQHKIWKHKGVEKRFIQLNPSAQESFLIANIDEILTNLCIKDWLQFRLLKKLFTNSVYPELFLESVFEIFSEKDFIDLLNEHKYSWIFLKIVLAVEKEDKCCPIIFNKIKTSESLRSVAEHFFYNYIKKVCEIENTDVEINIIKKIFSTALEIKKQLGKVPFLPEIEEVLRESAIKNQIALDLFCDYKILIDLDKDSAENILDFFSFKLKLKKVCSRQKYFSYKLIQQKKELFSNAVFLDKFQEIILSNFSIDEDLELPEERAIDFRQCIFWLKFPNYKFGIDLVRNQKKLLKEGKIGVLIDNQDIDDLDIFFKDLFTKFPKTTTYRFEGKCMEYTVYENSLGELTVTDNWEIKLKFGEKYNQKLPPEIQGLNWVYIFHEIKTLYAQEDEDEDEDDYDEQIVKKEPKKFCKPILKSEIKEEISYLCNLPYENGNIYHVFYANFADKHLYIALDGEFSMQYILQADDKEFSIFDLNSQQQIQSLREDHPLAVQLEGIKSFIKRDEKTTSLEFIDRNKRICKLDINQGQIILSRDPIYNTMRAIPYFFPTLKKGLCLVNQEDNDQMELIVSGQLFKSISVCEDILDSTSPTNMLFCYHISKEKIIPHTKQDELYLIYLKILSQSPDVYHHIHRFFRAMKHVDSIDEGLRYLIDILVDYLNNIFEKSGIYKDPFSLLHVRLFVLINEKNILINTLSETASAYAFYSKEAQLPFFTLLSKEEEKLIRENANRISAEIEETNKEYKKKFLYEPMVDFYNQNWSTERLSEYLSVKKPSIFYVGIRDLSSQNEVLIQLIKSKNSKLDLELLKFKIFKEFFSSNCLGVDGNFFWAFLLILGLEPTLIDAYALTKSDSVEEALNKVRNKDGIPYLLDIYKKVLLKPTVAKLDSIDSLPNYPISIIPSKFEDKVYNSMLHRSSRVKISEIVQSTAIKLTRFHLQVDLLKKLKLNFILNSLSSLHSRQITVSSDDPLFNLPEIPDLEDVSAPSPLKKRRVIAITPEASSADHIHLIISSLNTMIEEKEKSLLDFVYGLDVSRTDKKEISAFFASRRYSHYHARLSFEDLLYLLVDRNKITILNRLGLLHFKATRSSQEIEKFCQILMNQIAALLLLKIELREFNKLKETCQLADIRVLEEAKEQIENHRLAYSEDKIDWLVFEYFSGFSIRHTQKVLLADLDEQVRGNYKNSVAQLMMGGGKTSVLSTLILKSITKTKRLGILVLPASQKKIVAKTLKASLSEYFTQGVIEWEFSRKELNKKFIIQMASELIKAKISSSIVITTPESIQALELEFLSVIADGEGSIKEGKLREILLLLKEEADCLVDEFAHVADVNKLTNFPILNTEKIKKKLPRSRIDLFAEIFHILSLDELTKITKNEQMYLSSYDMNQVVENLCCKLAATLYPKIAQFKEHYPVFNSIKSVFDFLSAKELGAAYSFILQGNEDDDLYQILALANLTIHHLLPAILKKCGGRNYGRTPNPKEAGKIIPYLGVGSPSTTLFGFAYEALAYHFLYALQFGVSPEQIEVVASLIFSKAKIKADAASIEVDATEEGQLFHSLTGVLLSRLDEPDAMDVAYKKLEEERKSGEFTNLLQLEAYTAEQYVSYYPEYYKSNPHNLLDQFRSVRGLTGTPWNHVTYGMKFQNHLILDSAVEEKVCESFRTKEKVVGMPGYAHITKNSDPDRLLKDILQKTPLLKEQLFGLIDSGGMFKEFDNQTVAKKIMEVLHEIHKDTVSFSVLYFGKNEGEILPDAPKALLFDHVSSKETLINLADFSLKSIKEMKIDQGPYFVYYDERHTFGTDVALPEEAVCLITIDKKTSFSQLAQGLLRMRGYFAKQNAICVIPEILASTQPECIESPEKLLDFTKKNEKALLSSMMMKSYKQQITNVLRREILDFILKDKRNNSLLKHFRDLFLDQEEDNPIGLLLELNQEVKTPLEQLNLFAESNYGLFSKLISFEGIKLKAQAQIQEILDHAKRNIDCLDQEVILDNLFTEMTVEQQMEVNQSIELQQETTLVQEASHYLSDWDSKYPEESPLDIGNLLQYLSHEVVELNQLVEKFSIIPLRLLKLQSSKEYPYESGFSQLFLSKNSIKKTKGKSTSLFDLNRKMLHSLLIVISRNKKIVFTIGLTNNETSTAVEYFKKYPQGNSIILNSSGDPLIDSLFILPKDDALFYSFLQKSLLEMKIFNHEIHELAQFSSDIYEWLNDSRNVGKFSIGELRVRFLKILGIIMGKIGFESAIDGLKSGELITRKERELVIATEKIALANAFLEKKEIEQVEKVLKQYPKRYLANLPSRLISHLPYELIRGISDREKIKELSEEKLSYLKKGQFTRIDKDKIKGVILSDSRRDLATIFKVELKSSAIVDKKLSLHLQSRVAFPMASEDSIGFPNLGSTCFVNATLKAFLTITPYQESLKKALQQKKAFEYHNPDTDILEPKPGESGADFAQRHILQRSMQVIAEIYQTKGPGIKKALRRLFASPLFKDLNITRQQQDADEFFKIIADSLEMNSDPKCSMKFFGDNQSSIIPLNYYQSGLALDLSTLLGLAMSDQMNFSHNQVEELKTIGLQLPRFKRDRTRNPQTFTELLDPPNLSVMCREEFWQLQLRPKAFVCHSGTLAFGHYTTVTIDGDICLLHNDKHVWRITREEANAYISDLAYLAFYDVSVVNDAELA